MIGKKSIKIKKGTTAQIPYFVEMRSLKLRPGASHFLLPGQNLTSLFPDISFLVFISFLKAEDLLCSKVQKTD
jgi:hypothetical protein